MGKKNQPVITNAQELPTATYQPGEVIIKEGDRDASTMYAIVKGAVGVYKDFATPKQKLLANLNEGDYFGEMAVIESKPRTASIVATEKDTVVQIITSETFNLFIEQNADKVALMLTKMGKRISDSYSDYIDACEVAYDFIQAYDNEEEFGPRLERKMRVFSDRYKKAIGLKEEI